jgi:hypothetical protein
VSGVTLNNRVKEAVLEYIHPPEFESLPAKPVSVNLDGDVLVELDKFAQRSGQNRSRVVSLLLRAALVDANELLDEVDFHVHGGEGRGWTVKGMEEFELFNSSDPRPNEEQLRAKVAEISANPEYCDNPSFGESDS